MKFLDKKWLNSHLKQVKNKAGNRYTPELNIDLPVSEVFGGIGRTVDFYITARTHFGTLRREFNHVSSKYENKSIQRTYDAWSKRILVILKIADEIKEYDVYPIPWKSLKTELKRANKLSWSLSSLLYKEKEKPKKALVPEDTSNNGRSSSDRFGGDIHYLNKAEEQIRYFERFVDSATAKLSNKPFLILKGVAGTGKTHLLCDVMKQRLSGDVYLPSVLIFGEFLNNNSDIWSQISKQLGLKNYTKEKLLNALNRAGKKNSARSIIVIDALNETRPISFWQKNLKKLQRECKKYPHIGLIVSIRSGFEKEILSTETEGLFVHQEHHGFQFREWEAVNKFFGEFKLPLPEIPLLTPEFQNPLFLLLFCKAFQSRAKKKGKKEIFRGHEGATYIFESFVDSVSKRISKQFGIDNGPGKNIWDTVIEKVAEDMVSHNEDRIPEDRLMGIVTNEHPLIKHGDFLKELEKNLLLIKVPRYSVEAKDVDGFDFRFPFQKFSDHLIARYIFKKYRVANRTPKQFFSRNTKIGKFLEKSWNRGIIEALSIQCPEQLNGIEFFEVAPYINDYLKTSTFVESLVWRRPNAFSVDAKTALKYINQVVIKTDEGDANLLNTMLAVAQVPGHPFNALFLHRNLFKMTMPKRDGRWSTFLHYQHGEKGAVDRLIEWGWSEHNKAHINDESLKLCAIALSWFLTTPDRFIRDKATKALVEILTPRLSILIEILELFKGVNDPYITERLYAVAYGCVLRNKKDSKEIAKLATWFYKNIFKKKIPKSILLRDYARGVVEFAIDKKIVKIDKKEILPPYGSKWPNNTPTEKFLKAKYYPEDFFKDKTKDRGYLDIWSSVMHSLGSLGDFGRYEVDSALGHWSGRRHGSKQVSKSVQFETFKESLDKSQSDLFNKINPFHGINLRILMRDFDSEETDKPTEEEIKEREKADAEKRAKSIRDFKNSLSEKRRKYYEKQIEPHLDGHSRINDPVENFDTGLGQRWIFNRVVKLGWSQELHGTYDTNAGRGDGRSEHKAERIGKKYQWIAFHELLAMVADNFEFKGDRWRNEEKHYNGPWHLSVRDIDPTCTLREFPKNSIDTPAFKKPRLDYNAWRKNVTHKTWLKASKDLPNPEEVMELVDDKGISWVVMEGFHEWQEPTPPEHEKYQVPTRTLWYMIKSYIVKKEKAKAVYEWALKQNFMGRWMPESHEFYNIHLEEYPSRPAFLDHYIPYYHHDGWTDGGRDKKIPARVLVTDDEYMSSGSSIDCSTNGTVHVKLPAKLIVDEMNLVQKHSDGRFYNEKDELVVFDPTIFNKDFPRYLLFRKDRLNDFLNLKGYEIMWTLLGEKNLIGGGGMGQPWGWLEVSGAYKIDKKTKKLTGSTSSKFKKPTRQTIPKRPKTKRTKKIDSILGQLLRKKARN
jgi:hypothetical protein